MSQRGMGVPSWFGNAQKSSRVELIIPKTGPDVAEKLLEHNAQAASHNMFAIDTDKGPLTFQATTGLLGLALNCQTGRLPGVGAAPGSTSRKGRRESGNTPKPPSEKPDPKAQCKVQHNRAAERGPASSRRCLRRGPAHGALDACSCHLGQQDNRAPSHRARVFW